ncbi:MAG: hypothetical protein J6D37_08060 [Clostridia bacterium]|nr:hypothetical protein [Clostridia bacterium]
MEKLKAFVQSRGIGFWVSSVIAVLMLVLAIIYRQCFYWSQYYDARTLIFLIVGLAAGVILMVAGAFFKPLGEWAPAALGAGVFLATLFFFVGSWLMIQDAVGGYEHRGFIAGFWPFVVMAILCIVGSIVNIIFLRQTKQGE